MYFVYRYFSVEPVMGHRHIPLRKSVRYEVTETTSYIVNTSCKL